MEVIVLIFLLIFVVCVLIVLPFSLILPAIDSVFKLLPFLLKYLWPCILVGFISMIYAIKKKSLETPASAFGSGFSGTLVAELIVLAILLNVTVTPKLIPEEQIGTVTFSEYAYKGDEWIVSYSDSTDDLRYISEVYSDIQHKKYTYYTPEIINTKELESYHTAEIFDKEGKILCTITYYDSRHIAIKNGIITKYYDVQERYNGVSNERPKNDIKAMKSLHQNVIEAATEAHRQEEETYWGDFVQELFDNITYTDEGVIITIPREVPEGSYSLHTNLIGSQIDESGEISTYPVESQLEAEKNQEWEPEASYCIPFDGRTYHRFIVTFKAKYYSETFDVLEILPEEYVLNITS